MYMLSLSVVNCIYRYASKSQLALERYIFGPLDPHIGL